MRTNRSGYHRQPLRLDHLTVEPVHHDPDPVVTQLLHTPTPEWYEQALETLPSDRHREVVDALVVGRLTREATAELLGISVPYVYRLWRQARETIGDQQWIADTSLSGDRANSPPGEATAPTT